MNRGYDRDFDYLDFDDESDHEGTESSEDELDIILHGTPEQKRKLQRNIQQRDSSSEDEFEKEMNAELNARVEALHASRLSGNGDNIKDTSSSTSVSNSKHGSKKSANIDADPSGVNGKTSTSVKASKFSDEVYIDSDEEEMVREGEERQKRRNPDLSNDDLLYDPNMDDEDQRWIDKHRRKNQPKTTGNVKPLPKSDAVLNCPACMTTLCLDCQRHSLYKHQYRAMFVMNCNVDTGEILKQPQTKKSKKQKKRKTQQSSSDSVVTDDSEEPVHPVKCTECNTVVAVYDKDEIYHFFNVLASHA